MKRTLFLVMLLVLITAITATEIEATNNLTSKLLAYWNFSETSTASYDMVSNNSASWNSISSVAGIVGNGVSPSAATSYMTVATPSRFNNMVNGTMCFWLNQTSVFRPYTQIVWIDGGYPNNFATLGQWSGNASQLAYAYGTYWPTPGVEYATYFGKWTHICQVMDDTNDFTTLYANGVPLGNYSGAIALGDTVSLVYLLGQSGYSRAVIGSFDELGIWNRTLSYDEINYLYNGNSGAPCVYPFSCEAAPPGGVYWQQNITNITANHNGTPYIYSVKFNLTNSSAGCFATNITSNDSSHPIDNTTGWFNLTGANISATGVSWVKITGMDNCSNNVTQTFYVNITNTAPYNDAKDNNRTFNHNESLTVGTFCGDADNDALTYSMNDTAFSIYNGGIDYDPPTITAVGIHDILFGCSDGLINTTGVVRFNVTNTPPAIPATSISCTPQYYGASCSAYCQARDPDNNNLTVRWSAARNGTTLYSGASSVLSGVNVSLINFTDNGDYNYTIFCNSTDSLLNSTTVQSSAIMTLVEPVNPQDVFAYDYDSIPATGAIDSDSDYGFTIVGITVNQTNFNSEWTAALAVINHSKSLHSQRTMLRLVYDGDVATNTAYYNQSCTTAQNNLSILKTEQYYDDVAFIIIETKGQVNAINFTNHVAQCIVENTNNRYPIFSETLTTGLNNNYIAEWTMPRLAFADNQTMLTQQRGYMQNTTSKTRIYSGLSADMKSSTQIFHETLLNKVRGNIVGTATNITTSIGDVIFINNASVPTVFTQSVATGKDSWDATNKKQVGSDGTNATATLAANAYAYIIVDDLSHLTSSSVYKATTVADRQMTWFTGGGAAGSFSIGGANSGKLTLWDPAFTKDQSLFFHSYEQLQYSYVTNFSGYELIVISVDGPNTNTVVNQTLNVATNAGILNRTYGYLSVADYTNTDAWTNSKKTEVDNIINNYGMHIFIDGLDTGVAGENFTSRLRDVTDYSRVTKSKQVILNDYTAYQTVSAYGDIDMKESFCARWSGSVGSPAYAYENLTVDVDRAIWARTSTHPQLAMAFGAENDSQKLGYCYAMFLVLYGKELSDGSNNYFRYAQPDFQVQREIRVVDAGLQLETTWTEVNSTYWYRMYSNGRVWINPISHDWGIDNSRTITDLDICVYAQIAGGEPVASYTPINMHINGNQSTTYSISGPEIGASPWVANLVCKDISSSYSKNGRYDIVFYPQDRLAALKLNLWNENAARRGVNSYYDSDTPAYPVQETWTAYGRSGAATDYNTTNWRAMINVSDRVSGSIDSHSVVAETLGAITGRNRTLTITSADDYDLPYWSDIVDLTEYSNLTRITYNGTNVSFVNTSDCLLDIPTWTDTNISGNIHGTCMLNNGAGNIYLRIKTPHLSSQEYTLYDSQNVPPTIVFTNISNATYANESITFNATINDTDGNNVTVVMMFYNGVGNNTINQTSNITGNGTIAYSVSPAYFAYNKTVYAVIVANDSIEIATATTNNVTVLVYPPAIQSFISSAYSVVRTQDVSLMTNCTTPGGAISHVTVSVTNPTTQSSVSNATFSNGLYRTNYITYDTGIYYATATCTDTAGQTTAAATLNFTATQPEQTQGAGSSFSVAGSISNATIIVSDDAAIIVKTERETTLSFSITNPTTTDKVVNVTLDKQTTSNELLSRIALASGNSIDTVHVYRSGVLMDNKATVQYHMSAEGLQPGQYRAAFSIVDDTGVKKTHNLSVVVVESAFPQWMYDAMNSWDNNPARNAIIIAVLGMVLLSMLMFRWI